MSVELDHNGVWRCPSCSRGFWTKRGAVRHTSRCGPPWWARNLTPRAEQLAGRVVHDEHGTTAHDVRYRITPA